MASNNELILTADTGWLGGFSNLFRNESRRWWKTRQWLVQTLIWLVIVNGVVAMMVWTAPKDETQQAAAQEEIQAEYGKSVPPLLPTAQLGMAGFLAIAGLAGPVGVIILGQDAVLNEKHSGTAAWILSKPASRTTFILSKLAANSLGILVTMILIQGLVTYLQIWLLTGQMFSLLSFLGALALAFLNLLFYLALTIMLGTIFNGRGAVLGIPLALVFGYQLLGKFVGWLVLVMPWRLTNSLGPTQPSLALSLIQGSSLIDLTPAIVTAFWCLLFTGIALARFQREEF